MNRHLTISALLIATTLAGCGEHSSPATRPAGIWPTMAFSRLGGHHSFEAVLPGTSLQWQILGPVGSGFISRRGEYHAPLRGPLASPLLIQASTEVASATAQIVFSRDGFDSLDCFGVAQRADPPGVGEYVYVEDLPEAIFRVLPIYPDLARKAGVDGTVVVNAHVCACGQIMETRLARSIPMLDEAAVAAVRQWEFKPALINGEPVAVWVAVPVQFRLN